MGYRGQEISRECVTFFPLVAKPHEVDEILGMIWLQLKSLFQHLESPEKVFLLNVDLKAQVKRLHVLCRHVFQWLEELFGLIQEVSGFQVPFGTRLIAAFYFQCQGNSTKARCIPSFLASSFFCLFLSLRCSAGDSFSAIN